MEVGDRVVIEGVRSFGTTAVGQGEGTIVQLGADNFIRVRGHWFDRGKEANYTSFWVDENYVSLPPDPPNKPLEDFKKRVIQTVVDYPEGCWDQKMAFLKELGLRSTTTYRIEIDITLPDLDVEGDEVDETGVRIAFDSLARGAGHSGSLNIHNALKRQFALHDKDISGNLRSVDSLPPEEKS